MSAIDVLQQAHQQHMVFADACWSCMAPIICLLCGALQLLHSLAQVMFANQKYWVGGCALCIGNAPVVVAGSFLKRQPLPMQLALTMDVVYRRTKLSAAQLSKYKPETTFVWTSFTSTTTIFDPRDDFGRILFVIKISPTVLHPHVAASIYSLCLCYGKYYNDMPCCLLLAVWVMSV